MRTNLVKFETPGMGTGTKVLYQKLYGEIAGEQFIDILSNSPDEIAIISRLVAFLAEQKGVKG